MNADRLAPLSLLLSAITLILVVAVLLRPFPEPVDDDPALIAIAHARAEIAELRTLVERGRGPTGGGDSTEVLDRLDRIEESLAGVVAKVEAICGAIESSPFAPSGFACP